MKEVDIDLLNTTKTFCSIAYHSNSELAGYCFKDCKLSINSLEEIDSALRVNLRVSCTNSNLNTKDNLRIKTGKVDINPILKKQCNNDTNDIHEYIAVSMMGFDVSVDSSVKMETLNKFSDLFYDSADPNPHFLNHVFRSLVKEKCSLTYSEKDGKETATGFKSSNYINIDRTMSVVK